MQPNSFRWPRRGAGGCLLPSSTRGGQASRTRRRPGMARLNSPVRQVVMTWMIFDEVFMPPSGMAARTSRIPLR